jgi:metallo-beta-lactamase family protein
MKIKIVGASGGQVTGSAYLVETGGKRLLVDCGMFQGGRSAEARNKIPDNINRNLNAVLVTHGHLDHTGRLPLLSKLGYKGPVYATPATREMSSLVLKDAAKIQAQDVMRSNRRLERSGEPLRQPLYSPEEANEVIGLFRDVPYQKPVQILPGVKAIWAESGHMLGSASIQLLVEEGGREKRVVFSGDIGPRDVPIIRNFEPFKDADMVFLESTYGDRDHRPFRETVDEFVRIVKEAAKTRGKILVPTFAIGRAQLIMILLSWIFRNKHVEPFPSFLDSPMAIEATKIYTRHMDLFDDRLKKYIADRPLRDDLKQMQLSVTAKHSMAINAQEGPCLVMAGAGMCNAGRILHHLKANLWKPTTHLMIVGYQAQGSVGRQLVEGAQTVKILGEKVVVKGQVHTLGGFSAHAGQTELMQWLDVVAASKPKVVLVHGEDRQREALGALIKSRHGISQVIEL